MTMMYSIESIENGSVTLVGDDGQTVVVSLEQMAQPPRPGQLVTRDVDGLYHTDEAASQQRSSRVLRLLQQIRKKSTEFSDDHKNI